MAFYNTGKDFTWFIGVVEDVMDPGMLGRVKIRILNQQDSADVSTDELLWAYPISPIQSASLSSKRINGAQTSPGPGAAGISPTGIEVGSYAFGFFMDGEERNMPMLFGTYHKIPDANKDSVDSGEAAKSSEHDVSFLAREQQTLFKEETKGDLKLKSKRPFNVEEGTSNVFIKEPKSAYEAKYPNNKTITTKSGHALELDDTPGAERIHVYHRAGTYTEINKDGRRVQKIVGSDFEIVLENKSVLVKGNLSVEVDGDATVLVKGDSYNWVKGNVVQAVLQNVSQTVGGGVSQTIGGDLVQVVNGNINQTVQTGNMETKIEAGNYTLDVAKNMTVKVGGDFSLHTTGNTDFVGESNMKLQSKLDMTVSTNTNQALFAAGQQTLTAGTKQVIFSAEEQLMQATDSQKISIPDGTTQILNNTSITGTSTASVDHVSNGISGHDHTHTDTPGLGAGTTSPPQ